MEKIPNHEAEAQPNLDQGLDEEEVFARRLDQRRRDTEQAYERAQAELDRLMPELPAEVQDAWHRYREAQRRLDWLR